MRLSSMLAQTIVTGRNPGIFAAKGRRQRGNCCCRINLRKIAFRHPKKRQRFDLKQFGRPPHYVGGICLNLGGWEVRHGQAQVVIWAQGGGNLACVAVIWAAPHDLDRNCFDLGRREVGCGQAQVVMWAQGGGNLARRTTIWADLARSGHILF